LKHLILLFLSITLSINCSSKHRIEQLEQEINRLESNIDSFVEQAEKARTRISELEEQNQKLTNYESTVEPLKKYLDILSAYPATITGELDYPSEGVPENTIIEFHNLTTGSVTTKREKIYSEDFIRFAGFREELAPGIYDIYLNNPGAELKYKVYDSLIVIPRENQLLIDQMYEY